MTRLPWYLEITLASIVLTACGCSGDHQETKPLKVGIDEFVGFAPIYLARDQGLRVEPRIIPDTKERNAAFNAGKIDVICTTVDSLLLLAERGAPLTIIAAIDQSDGADGLLVNKQIKSIQDLKGRTVAFQEEMPSQFLLLWILNQNRMRLADVLAVHLEAENAGSAFAAGRVDAAVTWEPWLSKAAATGHGRVLVSSRDYPGVLVDALAVRTNVYERRQRDVIALYDAWMTAVDSIKKDPDRTTVFMSKKLNLGLASFRENLKTLKLTDRAFNRSFFDHQDHHSIWNLSSTAVQMWKDTGILTDATFDPGTHISSRIVELGIQAPK
jgi:NitT/TauT family transport system substrate-binding protein